MTPHLHKDTIASALSSTVRSAWPVALSVGAPLAGYLATASGYGYWLDGGEFVAQASDFGISHPPGHPLNGVVLGLFTWLLPIGSIAFRTAIASALLAAFAIGCVHFAAERTFRGLGTRPLDSSILAIGVCWLSAGSFGWWLQAVRPEVYALQAALTCFALERIVAYEAEGDSRKLYVATFAFALALANHHFLALLILPACAATLGRAVSERGWRPLSIGLGAGLLGLATYIYLPLRAGRAYLSLGDPNDLGRMWWVVSAEAFQKNQGEGVPQPLGERFADVAIQLGESLSVAVLFIALAGFYALIRQRSSRRLGILWLLIATVFIAARAWLGFVRSNPDALGYLMPAIAALSIAAVGFGGMVIVVLGERTRLTLAVATVIAGACAFQITDNGADASFSALRSPDTFDEELRRHLPTGSIVIAYAPQTAFRYWGGEAEEHLRPDISFVPVPFLTYPGMADALVERDEMLRPLLNRYMLDGEIDVGDLQTLASRRPVYVELDLRVSRDIQNTLVPGGLYHRVVPDGATRVDRTEGRDVERKSWARIERMLEKPLDPETVRQLVWRLYQRALYYADTGNREEARMVLTRALALQPQEQTLNGLMEALAVPNDDGEATGPIDTTPFRMMTSEG